MEGLRMRSGRRVRSGAQALVVTFVCLTAIHYSSTLTQGAARLLDNMGTGTHFDDYGVYQDLSGMPPK
jgi:hypothetical protein